MTPLNSLDLAGRDGADGRHDAELLLHLLDAVVEVGAHAVELVDEGDARHAVLVGLVPDGLGLHLDAADGAEDADARRRGRAGERSTSAVKSTWPGVSMRVMRVSPHSTDDGGAVDGDALGLFERVEVGGGVAVIDVADLVLGAAEVEDALGGRGLARVHVGDDADVAKFFEHGNNNLS